MAKDRLPWFKCYPTLLIGALSGMPPDVSNIYTMVLLRTYEVGGPCPDTSDVLSRRTGLTLPRVEKAITWLLDRGKLTRSDAGFVNPFAAKLLSERIQASQLLASAGKIGGEKSAAKRQVKTTNQPKPPSVSVEANEKPRATDLDSEIDVDSKNKKPRAKPAMPDDDYPEDAFAQFWHLYPPGRKGNKRAALAKFGTIHRRGEVTFTNLMAGLQRYVDSKPDPQFTKGPEVWLNKGCWDDEYVQHRGSHDAKTQSAQPTFAGLADAIRRRSAPVPEPYDGGPTIDHEPVHRR